ncbi:MAG: flavodoxin, partial [Desulfovibrio sp.]|nr:flavodoxin [Desulfovibrio sp.]
MSSVLVAYFSASGVTRALAERLAGLAGADSYEIVPAKPYSPQDLDWTDKLSRSSQENDDASARPAMAGAMPDLTGYGTVLLGFPIWWYKAPRIIQTFLEAGDFAGKRIAVFCTSGSSPLGKVQELLEPEAPQAQWLPGKRFEPRP